MDVALCAGRPRPEKQTELVRAATKASTRIQTGDCFGNGIGGESSRGGDLEDDVGETRSHQDLPFAAVNAVLHRQRKSFKVNNADTPPDDARIFKVDLDW